MHFERDVAIVGGCGRVGLPLGLAFADRGLNVALFDKNSAVVSDVGSGRMPFLEDGADAVLGRVLGERLTVTTNRSVISSAECVVIVVGTPVDEHLNPDPTVVSGVVESLADCFRDGQLLILRSTLYPGTTALVERRLKDFGFDIDVAFCPERIAEGRALTELYELPQIVAAHTPAAFERGQKLFRSLAPEVVQLEPEEAELAKLFTNTWRYIKFATANQFYMMANEFGLDYERIRSGLAFDYPRAADLPRAGFAAGPCLLKDTMQLAAFNRNNFLLGHAAMTVNEGLPLYVVSRLERAHDLASMTVGVLGMSFKAGSDDTRDSLSYKLKRILKFRAKHVVCHDPYVRNDPDLRPLDEVLGQADLLIIATPHPCYGSLETDVPVIDITEMCEQGRQP